MLALLLQTAAAWFAAGFIWTMQILHYPLFSRVGEAAFPEYEREHNRRFLPLVAPPLLVVAVTAVWLLVRPPARLPLFVPAVTLVLVAVIVASTARFQAPAHGRLARSFDPSVLAGLVAGNWVRTAAWTAVGVLDLLGLGLGAGT